MGVNSGRLAAGATTVLVVIITELMVAFVATGDTSSPRLTGCDPQGNVTACETIGKTTFLSTLFSIAVSGFEGVFPIVNVIWVTVMGGLLTIGILLILTSFLPLVSA
jgi:hypothetical protein